MAVKVMGEGDQLTVRMIQLVAPTRGKPWVVYKSDDAGIWPIETFKSEKAAQDYASKRNEKEEQQLISMNAAREREGKPPYSRELFDEYFARKETFKRKKSNTKPNGKECKHVR